MCKSFPEGSWPVDCGYLVTPVPSRKQKKKTVPYQFQTKTGFKATKQTTIRTLKTVVILKKQNQTTKESFCTPL